MDGSCPFCRRGRENLCLDSRYTGYDVNGGYAEYAVVPEDFAYELPNDFDDERKRDTAFLLAKAKMENLLRQSPWFSKLG